MKTIHWLRMIGVALLVSLSLGKVSAQDLPGRLDEAWKDAMEDQEGVLTAKQIAMLHDVAYQAAAARVCDGINISVEKYAKAVNDLVADIGDKFDDEKEMVRNAHTLIMLGTSYGLFLAEGNENKEKFCKAAAEAKADTSTPHLWE